MNFDVIEYEVNHHGYIVLNHILLMIAVNWIVLLNHIRDIRKRNLDEDILILDVNILMLGVNIQDLLDAKVGTVVVMQIVGLV